ncbi:unnamed protein product [Peniophora sp. CBMAI 1063]|nr:unnamed protein product [Peniophora sp. CBMAI 1063]
MAACSASLTPTLTICSQHTFTFDLSSSTDLAHETTPARKAPTMIQLLELPVEILAIILDELDVEENISLSETCKALNGLVKGYGWRGHLDRRPRQAGGTARAMASWSALAQVQYHARTDQAWARRSPRAFPLARPWRGKLQPVVASSPSRLVVAAGHHLYSYSFAPQAAEGHAPHVRPEFICALGAVDGDATALAFSLQMQTMHGRQSFRCMVCLKFGDLGFERHAHHARKPVANRT